MTPVNINLAKQKIDIVEIIQQSGVQIRKQGKDYFGCCPFHSEKTASFSVSPAKQIYHCFGCGAGGDVIEFVMEYHNLDFPGALQYLGIEQTTPQTKQQIRKQSKARYRAEKRKAYQDKLYKEFKAWIVSYQWYCIEWIDLINSAMKMLSWEHIKKLSDLIKQVSTWRYHSELIETGDEPLLYELYQDLK